LNNVFLVTPSYLMKKKGPFSGGIRQLEKLGFTVLNPDFPKELPSPREKAEQLHQAFADPLTDIILALRGGYGAMKCLPFLDFELIRKNPKIITGYSDLSALLNPIYQRTGMVTLHAPMLTSLDQPTQFTLDSFLNALKGYPEKNLFKGVPVKVYNSGVATGILKGGNLTTLAALAGTDWELETDNSILFLEDVDEKPHKIDRFLTQWILAGKFKGVKGLVLGDFSGIGSRQVYQMLASQMGLDFPVVHCPYLGHVDHMISMPIGAEVELNTAKKQLMIKQMSFPGATS
jgi:muramoyltetrapeptide carboxypeptidase